MKSDHSRLLGVGNAEETADPEGLLMAAMPVLKSGPPPPPHPPLGLAMRSKLTSWLKIGTSVLRWQPFSEWSKSATAAVADLSRVTVSLS